MVSVMVKKTNRGPAPFHRLTPNKRFEPVFSTVIMAVCSIFNRMLLSTDLIPVHLLYCGQTVMIGCNHTSFEWTRAVRHVYGIIRHMQGLYTEGRSIWQQDKKNPLILMATIRYSKTCSWQHVKNHIDSSILFINGVAWRKRKIRLF